MEGKTDSLQFLRVNFLSMKVGFVSIIKMSSYKTTSMRDVEGRNTVTEVNF